MTVLRCAGMADGTHGPETGKYLAGYDPATGEAEWSSDRSDAKEFTDVVAAHLFWTQVHPTESVRSWDGQPNRPLTAFSVLLDA